MAPTLTSNSFLPTPAPRPRLFRSRNVQHFRPFAKKNDEESAANGANPFGFKLDFNLNFDKVGDVKSLIPVVSSPSLGLSRRKDANTVFVAGATGQAGVRIAQTLLREGFSVRAGVPELGAAQELARFASSYKIISSEETRRLNAVESTFQDAESIAKAIGNASKAVVTIGPAENGPTTEVTMSDALKFIQAAQLAGVGHVAIIYDRSSSLGASTDNVLGGISSFFSSLFSNSKPLTLQEFINSLVETDIGYTLIKTKLTEDYSPEGSYNIVVSAEGNVGEKRLQSNVAKSQLAVLVANVFSNTEVAENKVVEVFTDPSAPARPVSELFSTIPVDGRRAAYAEAIAKAKAEEEALIAAEKAQEAADAAKKLEKEVKKLSEQEARAASLAEEAKEKAAAAGTSFSSLLNKAKDASSGLSWEAVSSQLASAVKKTAEEPKVKIATVRGQAKARSLTPKKAVIKESKQPEPKAEVKKIFGGIFQQETIYVDD